MSFNFESCRNTFFEQQATDTTTALGDTAQYGVQLEQVIGTDDVAPGQSYWRVLGVHHLTPDENREKHNIYVDLLDEQGNPFRNADLHLKWGWEGESEEERQRATSVNFDKPASEPMGNVPIDNKQQNIWVEIEGWGLPSDRVSHMNTNHPDEDGPDGQTWNSFGHHSFYIVFQRTQATDVPSTPPAPRPEPAHENPSPAGVQQLAPKIGLDGNAPINSNGDINPQVADPSIIADTGAGWVRINFILGPWSSPNDTTPHSGKTWEQTYSQIINGFRNKGMKIYGLIDEAATSAPPNDEFRDPPNWPQSGLPENSWINGYVQNFATILTMFRADIEAVESFNEPDDWHGGNRNWIHPEWFAVMLQRIYDKVHSDPNISHIKLISGSVQGLTVNNNAGQDYLNTVYKTGQSRLGWGNPNPFPFDGVGYHIYVAEGFTTDSGQQEAAIRDKYGSYFGQMIQMLKNHQLGSKQLYISEFGWFTNGNNQPACEQFQAESLQTAFNILLTDPQIAPHIGYLSLFCTQDFGDANGDKFYGIYRKSGLTPNDRKPAYEIFKAICMNNQGQAAPATIPAQNKQTPQRPPSPVQPQPQPVSPGLNLGSKLGLFVGTASEQIFDLLATQKVSVLKTIELNPDFLKRVKETSPHTIVIARDANLTSNENQPDISSMDGVQVAKAFVENLKQQAANLHTYVDGWEGYNELNPDNSDQMKRLSDLEAERTRLLAQQGIRSVIGNFATGNPDLKLWDDFLPAIQAAQENNGWLGLHEYAAPTMYFDTTCDKKGPQPEVHPNDDGWLTLRYRKVYKYLQTKNLAIPLIMTECGIDGTIGQNSAVPGAKGWSDFQNYWAANNYGSPGTAAYMNQLTWYNQAMKQDNYVVGGCIFLIGSPSNDWVSFDIHGEMGDSLKQYLAK